MERYIEKYLRKKQLFWIVPIIIGLCFVGTDYLMGEYRAYQSDEQKAFRALKVRLNELSPGMTPGEVEQLLTPHFPKFGLVTVDLQQVVFLIQRSQRPSDEQCLESRFAWTSPPSVSFQEGEVLATLQSVAQHLNLTVSRPCRCGVTPDGYYQILEDTEEQVMEEVVTETTRVVEFLPE